MKKLVAAIIITIISLPWAAQSQSQSVADDSQVLPAVLAIVNGVTISPRDLEKSTGAQVRNLQKQVAEARERELDLQINSKLLASEAKKRGITTGKLLEQEVVAKVKPPTQAEAQTFYDRNKARIEGDFNSVKDDILRYLLDERQRVEAKKFADGLRAASNTVVKVPQATLPRNDAERAQVLATVNGENITSGDVEESLKPLIFDVQEQVYNLRKNELDLTINDTLLAQEAQKRKITPNALLDAEVKPRQVTEEQARAFYEQNKERVSGDFAQTKDSIISYLQQTELRLAERAFVEKLRATASVQVFLKAPESPVFSISTKDQPSLGNDNAAVTIVAFTDYQCPSCASIHPSLERLVNENAGKVRLVTRDFPLSQHAEAFKAAEAAEAAREQGKYWEYVHVLMQNQSALGVDKLKTYASDLGLDCARFDTALDSGRFAAMVERDIEEGMKLGVKGTPSLFINGRRVTAKSYEDLKASVEAALKSSTSAGQ